MLGKEQDGVVVARTFAQSDIRQRALPLAVWVPSAVTGGILGGMGVVGSDVTLVLDKFSLAFFLGPLVEH